MPAIPISARARAITDSITLAISARAAAMKKEGIDVVSLSAGEPDFGTPTAVAEAGIRAIRDGYTRYTPAAGMPDVRAAASRWFERHFGLSYAPSDVMVTAGAKPALHLALDSIVDRGDRVLLPAPFWASYTDLVQLSEGVPVVVDAVPEQEFVHSGEQIARAAEENHAKGIVLNFPNNPSGAVPTRAQLESIVDAAIEHDMWILSDEIYARLIYDDRSHVSPASFERARERVIVVNGGTKSHSMTGWRVGFLAGPSEVVAAAARIQSQAMGNTCSISQRAVLEVCDEEDDSELQRRVGAFDERRRYLVEELARIPKLRVEMPHGAFYVLVDVREFSADLGIDDVAFAERLLVEGLVATVPGTPFAIPGFVRLSYAASMDDLRTAVGRVADFCGKLT